MEDDNGNNFWKGFGIIAGIATGVALLIGIATPDGWLRKWIAMQSPAKPNANPSAVSNNPEENKCVLRNARGEEITITSESNSDLFRRYCQQGSTQPYYINYYWYRPVRWYYRRGWHGHPHNGNGNGDNGGNGENGGTT